MQVYYHKIYRFHFYGLLYPYPAEFLKWSSPPSSFGTVQYHFQRCQDENLQLVSQQYRAWSDCTDVQAGLALYWWQTSLFLKKNKHTKILKEI